MRKVRKRRQLRRLEPRREPYLVILDNAAPPMLVTVWLAPGEPLPMGRLATVADLERVEE